MKSNTLTRRDVLKTAGAALAGSVFAACEKRKAEVQTAGAGATGPKADFSGEEYVWISPHANLPLYVAHDHPALHNVARELGVQVTIAGPDTVDIPATIATIEQTAARKPAGIMVSGWDPSAFVAPINMAIESGIPVVTVDVDVPGAGGWLSSAPTGSTWAPSRRRPWSKRSREGREKSRSSA